MRLQATDAAVEGDQLLEGAALLQLGVEKLPTMMSATCWKPSVRSRRRGAWGENGGERAAPSTRPSARADAVAAERDRPVLG